MKDLIQKLREMTGAGIMDCKKAVEETRGNLEAALKIIEERGIAKAEKKGERKTGAGRLEAYIHAERIGVLLKIRSETDFVAKSEEFKKLSHEIAMQIAAMNPESPEELLEQASIKDPSVTIDGLIKKSILRLGENIKVERFCRYEI